MPTYRDLYDKLATLSAEQLDSEIKIIPVGYTDDDAAAILSYPNIPKVLELTKCSRNIYHCHPQDDDILEPGLVDFSDDEVRDMGINEDEDYTLVCKRGETVFKLKDNIQVMREEAASFGNLDTSILHL